MKTLCAVIFAAHSFALMSSVFAADSRNHVLMTEAVVLMTNDHKQSAYKIFETVFESSQNQQDRINSAMVLAFAENKFLKKHKRHFYAHFLTKLLPAGSDRSACLRIAGDGFFEDMDLDGAARSYNELMASENPSDQDYGHYKMGWVELNRKQAPSAFKRWHERLISGQGRSQDLRMSFVRDLGRAWAESVPATIDRTKIVKDLALTEKETKEFADGVSAGMRRLDEESEFPAFREQLRQTRYFSLVTNNVLSQGAGLNKSPCAVMDWFGDAQYAKNIDPELLMPRLNSCNFDLHKRLKDGFKESKDAKKLLSFYEVMSLRGIKRWPRAAFLKEINSNVAACEDSVNMISEESPQVIASGKLKDAFENFVESCRIAATTKMEELEKVPSVYSGFVTILRTTAKAGLLTLKEENPLYGLAAYFLKSNSFRTQLLNVHLEEAKAPGEPLFRKTLLPAQLLEALSSDERLQWGDTLLASFGPRPLIHEEKTDQIWIELIRSQLNSFLVQKQYQKSFELLDRHIPLSSLATVKASAEKRQSLWMLWAMALPSSEKSLQLKGLEAAKLSLAYSDKKPAEVLALSVKYELLTDAWAQWAMIKKATLNSKESMDLANIFFQKLFEKSLEDSKLEAMLKSHSDGELVLKALSFVKANESSSSKFISSTYKPAFLADIAFIEELKKEGASLTNSKLRFNAQLPKLIESKVKGVQAQVDSLKSHVWSHGSFGKLARVVVAKTCKTLAGNIDGISYPSAATAEQVNQWRAQLSQISTTVRGWQQTLVADGGL